MKKSFFVTFCLILAITIFITSFGELKSRAFYEEILCQTNSKGSFIVKYDSNTLCVNKILPYDKNITKKINGKICSTPILYGNYISVIYKDNDFRYNLYMINTENESYNNIIIGNPKVTNINSFSVSENKYFLILRGDVFSYVVAFDFNNNLTKEYKFNGQNVVNLFCNDFSTYVQTYDGIIYKLDNDKSIRVNSISSKNFWNCGKDYISDGEKIYSLKEEKEYTFDNISNKKFSVCNDMVCFCDSRTLFLSNLQFNNIKKYDFTGEISKIAFYNDEIAVVYNDYNDISYISKNDFKSDELKNDNNINGEQKDNNNSNSNLSNSEDRNEDINIKSGYIYKISDDYLCNVPSGTSVKELKEGFSADITVLNGDKNVVKTGNIKTGYFIKTTDREYQIAVNGDVTGEGNVNSRDITALMNYFIGENDIDGIYKKAADFNIDNQIDNKDLVLISRNHHNN